MTADSPLLQRRTCPRCGGQHFLKILPAPSTEEVCVKCWMEAEREAAWERYVVYTAGRGADRMAFYKGWAAARAAGRGEVEAERAIPPGLSEVLEEVSVLEERVEALEGALRFMAGLADPSWTTWTEREWEASYLGPHWQTARALLSSEGAE